MTSLRKNTHGFAHTLALLSLVVVLGVGSVGYYVYNKTKENANNSEVSETEVKQEVPLTADLTGVKTIDEIKTAAAGDIGTNAIRSIELELEDGTLVYKVTLSDKTVLVFDAKTAAQVTTTKATEAEFEVDDNLPANTSTVISADKAKEVAQAAQPGKTITKIELEMEEGKLVFSVRFSDKSRVDVDATTGAVVRTKTTTTSSNSGSTTNSTSNSGSGSSNSGSSKKTESGTSEKTETETEHTTTTSSGGSSASITQDQAKTIAMSRLPGKTVEKIEAETEDGAAVFSVRFTDDSRVDVRQSDGAIVKVVQ